jgi:hypothetical protein
MQFAGIAVRRQMSLFAEVSRGSILPATWESVQVHPTGKRSGYFIEVHMRDRRGRIPGTWWISEADIV